MQVYLIDLPGTWASDQWATPAAEYHNNSITLIYIMLNNLAEKFIMLVEIFLGETMEIFYLPRDV